MKAKEIAQKLINSELKVNEDLRTVIEESETMKTFVSKLSTLPELVGTEKQIIWASNLREKFISKMAYEITAKSVFMNQEGLEKGLEGMIPEYAEKFNKFANEAIRNSKNTSAKFWIEEFRFEF